MGKHFELTEETQVITGGIKLYRIKATSNIDRLGVKIGDIGGWVEREDNLTGNACVYGNACVDGDARVYGDADICWLSTFGSAGRTTTAFRTSSGVKISCGCFFGSIGEFVAKIKLTHRGTKYEREYMAMVELIRAKFEVESSL